MKSRWAFLYSGWMDDNDRVDEPTGEVSDLPTDSAEASSTSVILNLEGLIKNHTSSIQRLRDGAGKLQDMLSDIFENDPTYKEHLEQAKQAAKVKNATKAQILKQPQAADLTLKVKDIKAEIKETQQALSDYLGEYYRLSGISDIEGEDGRIRSIVYVAKLVDKSPRR